MLSWRMREASNLLNRETPAIWCRGVTSRTHSATAHNQRQREKPSNNFANPWRRLGVTLRGVSTWYPRPFGVEADLVKALRGVEPVRCLQRSDKATTVPSQL